MANYAVIEDNVVVNVIVANSKNIAEEITGRTCIEVTQENPIGIGWEWSADLNKYVSPPPFPSWIHNGEQWVPPIPVPEDPDKRYQWSEDSISWQEIVLASE